MRFFPSVFSIKQEAINKTLLGDEKQVEVRIMACLPKAIEYHHAHAYHTEMEALIAGAQQVLEYYRDIQAAYGNGPYRAIYQTGTVLPIASSMLAESRAELYTDEFERWTEYMQFIADDVDLPDPRWHWGDEPLFADQAEADYLIAAKGQPKVQPDIYPVHA